MGCCEPVLAPVQNYYTKSQVDRMISGITVSGVTQEELDAAIESATTKIEAEIPVVPTQVSAFENDVPYLTEHQSLSGYATEEWVTDQHYITGVDLSDYATEEWVEEKHYITGVDLSDYATTAYVNTEISAQTGDFIDGEELSSYTYDKATIDAKIVSGGTFDPTQYYDKAATDELLEGKLDASAYTPVDLSDYYTKSETNSQISSATADMATQTWVDNQGYLTEHQSLAEYYTKSEVNGIVTSAVTDVESEIPSLSGYATEQWVTDQHYITGVDLSDYATKSEIPVVPTNVSAFNNDAGYLTEHQSLSAYSTTAEVDIMLETATSGKADTSALTAVDDAMTGHTSDSTIHVTAGDKEAWNGKQDALTPGEGIVISGNVISATGGSSGGGATYSAGTNISIDSANTISCTLPITYADGKAIILHKNEGNTFTYDTSNVIVSGIYNEIAEANRSVIFGSFNKCNSGISSPSYIFGTSNSGFTSYSVTTGYHNISSGQTSPSNIVTYDGYQSRLVNGCYNKALNGSQIVGGYYNTAYNVGEFASGLYNNSVSASTAFGDSGNTLFSIGNGTAENARHNALEVKQNGDIYFNDGTNDVKLQDKFTGIESALGGLKFQKMTLQEYSTISGSADSNTIYFIKD